MKTTISLLVVLAFLFVGCTDLSITQITNPSDVAVGMSEPVEPAEPGSSCSITLEPSSITVAVGKQVHVLVTARCDGQEVPSADITASVNDKTVLRFAGRTDRTLTFEGLAVGETDVIVTASRAQASLVATVT